MAIAVERLRRQRTLSGEMQFGIDVVFDQRDVVPREQFEAMVARIVEYVHAGDAFQVVPSQRWSAELDADPTGIFWG